jgi:predicted MPP superfamily phosphohydrolase
MSSMAQFWVSVSVFHAVLLPVCLVLGRRWRRPHGTDATLPWLRALTRDALIFLGVVLVMSTAAVAGVRFDFTQLRLMCQALFGEGILLAAWIALAHHRQGLHRRALIPGLVAVGLLGIYWDAYHHEPHTLVVRHHRLDLVGRPAARHLRILHMTDIQTAAVGSHEEQALRAGLAENPDLIVLTGDYVQERLEGPTPTHAQAVADLRALIQRAELRAPLGVFAVQGDAESDCASIFRSVAVTCLSDEAREIALPDGSRLALVGLRLETSRGRARGRARSIVDAAPSADVTLVVGHRPDFIQDLVGDTRVDLVLAGHTHGGQVVLPLFGPPITRSALPRRYAGGLNDYGGLPLHVSRGVGMERGTAPQIRFLCPPEICILDVGYGPLQSASARRSLESRF